MRLQDRRRVRLRVWLRRQQQVVRLRLHGCRLLRQVGGLRLRRGRRVRLLGWRLLCEGDQGRWLCLWLCGRWCVWLHNGLLHQGGGLRVRLRGWRCVRLQGGVH